VPNEFIQFLRMELPRSPKYQFKAVTREEYDAFTMAEIVGYFARFLTLNLRATLTREEPRVRAEVIRLTTLYQPAITTYDTTPPPPGDFWTMMQTPHPRENLIRDLNRFAETLMAEWQAAMAAPVVATTGGLRGMVRPLVPGYSIGVAGHGSGTIGAFIQCRGQVYILSNAHILAANPLAPGGAANVSQPSPDDGGGGVAAVTAWHSVILADARNPLDAGLALVQPGIRIDPRYPRIGELTGFRDPRPGETVRMVCRTSGYIQAVVTQRLESRNVTGVIPGHTVEFGPVWEIRRSLDMHTNLEGDSGGLWIAEDNKAVALNFSGGEDVSTSAAIPITAVMTAVQAQLGPQAGLVGIDGSVFARAT
jgi:hypothetical protein